MAGFRIIPALACAAVLGGCFIGSQDRPEFDPDLKSTGEYTCRNHGGLLTIEHIYSDQFGEKVIFTCKEGMAFENMIDYPKPEGVF